MRQITLTTKEYYCFNSADMLNHVTLFEWTIPLEEADSSLRNFFP